MVLAGRAKRKSRAWAPRSSLDRAEWIGPDPGPAGDPARGRWDCDCSAVVDAGPRLAVLSSRTGGLGLMKSAWLTRGLWLVVGLAAATSLPLACGSGHASSSSGHTTATGTGTGGQGGGDTGLGGNFG